MTQCLLSAAPRVMQCPVRHHDCCWWGLAASVVEREQGVAHDRGCSVTTVVVVSSLSSMTAAIAAGGDLGAVVATMQEMVTWLSVPLMVEERMSLLKAEATGILTSVPKPTTPHPCQPPTVGLPPLHEGRRHVVDHHHRYRRRRHAQTAATRTEGHLLCDAMPFSSKVRRG